VINIITEKLINQCPSAL